MKGTNMSVDAETIIAQFDRDRLTLDENETTLSTIGTERNLWRGWTNDPVWVRRWIKAGAQLVEYDKWGASFNLTSEQVRFFNPMSEEQREKMRALATKRFAE